MKSFAFVFLACLAGLCASEISYRSAICRDWIGRIAGRGHLRAMVNGIAVYDRDLDRTGSVDEIAARAVTATLGEMSKAEPVAASKAAREYNLLRWQFGTERLFGERMQRSGLTTQSLTNAVMENLRARQWIDKQLANKFTVTDEQCREFYRIHPDAFVLPQRFRASHLFLAAPPDAPPEVVETKRVLIEELSKRLERGEQLSDLAAEASEDEATKWRGGDLGFFAAARMLPEVFAAVQRLKIGETSKPVRSHLGFHILQLTAIESPRAIPSETARPEITGILQNARRRFLTDALKVRLTGEAEYFGGGR